MRAKDEDGELLNRTVARILAQDQKPTSAAKCATYDYFGLFRSNRRRADASGIR